MEPEYKITIEVVNLETPTGTIVATSKNTTLETTREVWEENGKLKYGETTLSIVMKNVDLTQL